MQSLFHKVEQAYGLQQYTEPMKPSKRLEDKRQYNPDMKKRGINRKALRDMKRGVM